MRLSPWSMLTGKALLCLFLYTYLCAGSDENPSQYLYKFDKDNHFVHEFTGESNRQPDFIYSPTYSNGRVVLYYAHWCPHCIHFKPKYIKFSNKIQEMSQKFHESVETFAVSCVPQSKICKDKKIASYPTVMFYPPKSANGTKIKYADLHPLDIFQMIGVSTTLEAIDQKAVSAMKPYSSESHDKLKLKPYFIHRSTAETFHDAHTSFDFAMKTAVFTQMGPLLEKPKKALQEFLFAMKRTLPISSSMRPLVIDLLKNFESVATSSTALNEIMSKHPPPQPVKKWSEASMQHGTGYTAGLWILFHIISVGLVQWNHFAIDDGQKIIPAAMADIQRNYIEHFFQCEVCRLNFLSDFDACMYDRCNRLATSRGGTLNQFIQYPLWLYETHNAINVRLRKERIEENIEEESFTAQGDVVWPPISSCPTCWLGRDKNRWDEVEVYKFLQQSYWLEDHGSEVLRILEVGEVGKILEGGEVGKIPEISFDQRDADEIFFKYIGLWCCLMLAMAVIWYRRRQFEKKGMHKKIEIDIPRNDE